MVKMKSSSFMLSAFFLFIALGSVFAADEAGKTTPSSNSYFVTVGSSDTIWRSANGDPDSWTQAGIGNQSLSLTSIAYGNKRLITTAINGSAWYSTDGKKDSWKDANLQMNASPNLNTKRLTSITYGNGRFMAAGYTAGKNADFAVFLQLKNGKKTWSSTQIAGPYNLNGITAGPNSFVAVGEHRTSACAQLFTLDKDATKIKTTPLKGVKPLSAICYGNGTYLAVGLNGQVYRLSNAKNSALKYTLDDVSNLIGVAYANKRFVAVGFGGRIFYSETAASKTSWKAVTVPEVFCFYKVAYGNGRFIVVGMDSNSKTGAWWSEDLNQWHKTSLEGNFLSAIVYKP